MAEKETFALKALNESTSLRAQISELEQERVDMKASLTSMEELLSGESGTSAEASKETASLRTQISELEKESAGLKAILHSTQETVDLLNVESLEERFSFKAQISDLEHSRDDLKVGITLMKESHCAEKEGLNAEVSTLKR